MSCLIRAGQLRLAQGFLFAALLAARLAAAPEKPVREPVVIKGESTRVELTKPRAEKSESAQVDEKGSVQAQRPVFLNIYLGSQALISDKTAVSDAAAFAGSNILRQNEVIYQGSGATFGDNSAPVTIAPAMRIEWELPFERLPFLPSWRSFSITASFDAVYSPTKNLLTSTGNFRYQNAQAAHVALTDLTYSGSLTATERHYSLTPMSGITLELASEGMQKSGMAVLVRVAGGVQLQSGQRNYELALNPQYVNAGVYSDTYLIKSSVMQSYSMAFLAAGRADLAFRFRLSGRLHMIVAASATFTYGFLPYDNYGIFQEQAGQNKNIYQKVVSGTADQEYMGIAPALFLALSTAI